MSRGTDTSLWDSTTVTNTNRLRPGAQTPVSGTLQLLQTQTDYIQGHRHQSLGLYNCYKHKQITSRGTDTSLWDSTTGTNTNRLRPGAQTPVSGTLQLLQTQTDYVQGHRHQSLGLYNCYKHKQIMSRGTDTSLWDSTTVTNTNRLSPGAKTPVSGTLQLLQTQTDYVQGHRHQSLGLYNWYKHKQITSRGTDTSFWDSTTVTNTNRLHPGAQTPVSGTLQLLQTQTDYVQGHRHQSLGLYNCYKHKQITSRGTDTSLWDSTTVTNTNTL